MDVQLGYKKILEGGKRFQSNNNIKPIKSEENNEIVTVITVVKNGEASIVNTIQSVVEQTYPNIEYIVLDGESEDRTIQILLENNEKIDYWSSRKDKGIYDAMNKGVELATGKWILFMNAGDLFYSSDVVGKYFFFKKWDCDILYGDCIVDYGFWLSRYVSSKKVEHLWRGMVFSHQAAFVKKEILLEKKFNIQNLIAADFELFYSLYRQNYVFHRIATVVARVASGGLSDRKRIATLLSYWKVVRFYGIPLSKNFYYIIILFNAAVTMIVKKFMPTKFIRYILKKKYHESISNNCSKE